MTKVTRVDLQKKKDAGERCVVVTAYDYGMTRLVDEAGVDAILVGDSLGMVVQGHDSTLKVTLDHMIYHTQCVQRAAPRAQVIADLPFGTFQQGPELALSSAVRLVQEGGAEGVKIEGHRLPALEAIAQADIPVWGHLGLTPQSIHAFGGFRVQGKNEGDAVRLVEDAKRVEDAGASLLVLECIPWDVARAITEALHIPTIGIGAGPHCDGQVLVIYDMLGFGHDFVPKFVRRYAETGDSIVDAVKSYAQEVRDGSFPTYDESYGESAAKMESAEEH